MLASLQLQTATILNSLTTPVLILNQDTILISYNKAFIDLIGYTEKEIANITVKQLKRLLKFKKNSKKKNNMYEYAIITAAGEKREITLRFSMTPVRDSTATLSLLWMSQKIKRSRKSFLSRRN